MNAIALILKEQQALQAIKDKEKREAEAKTAREKAAFDATGIPNMFDQIKHIKVKHWRDSSAEQITLEEHVKTRDDSTLRLLDLNGNAGVGWFTRETNQGAMDYHVVYDSRGTQSFREPDALTRAFVSHMAKFLPDLSAFEAKE